MKTLMKFPFLIAMALLTVIACGKKEPAKNDEPVVYEEAVEAAGNALVIESNDQMRFNKDELRAVSGTVTLTLKHVGKMEKSIMGHNLVILKPGTDVADFSLKAVDAKDTDYIPASEKDKVLAHTKLIGGGESDTIEFTIEKGTYDFICSFPGHASLMKGKLIVE
jgi:azurin